jgi:outer membrane protein OmpA-like peptidoglycan-associated protein
MQALEEELRAFPIQVQRVSHNVIVVDLGAEVLFDFDSTVIDTPSRVFLDRLARSLRRYPDIGLRVIGHADGVGSEQYNIRLSRRRAEAVAKYLKQRDVRGLWVQVEGRGSSEPALQAADRADSINRRIELYIQAAAQG